MVDQRERQAAFEAVRVASDLCAAAQGRLSAGDTLTKGDDSPVTVADFAAQAVVCATLTEQLGAIELVGEEDSSDLAGRSSLRDGVVDLVRGQLGERASADSVLDWISVGHADGSGDRHWTLDPIDGTKGFLRGDQYAIALALIEQGEVVLGVLGCPNLPNPDGSRGAIFLASEGACEVHYPTSEQPVPAVVAAPGSLAEARVCESVESGHSNHDHSARITDRLGILAEPYRIDSQCKYGAVARAATRRSTFGCRPGPITARRSGITLPASSWSNRPEGA